MTSHAYSAGIARNVSLVSSCWKFPYDTVIKFYPTNFKLDSRPLYLTAYQQLTKYGNSDHIYVRCLRRGQIEKITPLFLACDATEMYADFVISSKLLYISEELVRLFCLRCKYIYIVSVIYVIYFHVSNLMYGKKAKCLFDAILIYILQRLS